MSSSSSPSGTKNVTCADGPYTTESEATTAANQINDALEFPDVVFYESCGTLVEAKRRRKHEQSQKTGKLGLALEPMRSSETIKKWKYGRSEENNEERGY
jgi:hypothetical protein